MSIFLFIKKLNYFFKTFILSKAFININIKRKFYLEFYLILAKNILFGINDLLNAKDSNSL